MRYPRTNPITSPTIVCAVKNQLGMLKETFIRTSGWRCGMGATFRGGTCAVYTRIACMLLRGDIVGPIVRERVLFGRCS
jgi:hypothetical protein